ncbi:MAG: hypothetical protein GY936_20350 [Ignavibacteriae bacterium]|nr:hypothetical protein [Ignavibacteriota bacterium]
MRKIYILISLFVFTQTLFSQQENEKRVLGKVSYISSQFTYVKFNSTKGIKVNDTLFVQSKKRLVPKLIVSSMSSRSVAGIVVGSKINKGIEITAIVKPQKSKATESDKNDKTKDEKIIVNKVKSKQSTKTKSRYNKRKEKSISGRFSVSGYSSLSNIDNYTDYQKWRYSFSLKANKINGSKFSFSNYIVFNYRADEWNLLSDNFNNSFKVYELSGNYYFNNRTKLTIGRKINYKISNIGAIDGVQLETKISSVNIGAVVGTRPSFSDYGFDPNLFQTGIYASKKDSIRNGVMQNTVSLFQQMNSGTTDRRFVYFQHSNNIIKKVNLFFSSELDLFEKVNDENSNTLRLTSLYLSARYSPYRWLSLSTSYDARKNVIYYETFKNYAYRLLDEALRQGFRFRVNLRPINYVFASVYTGYRFREDDSKPTKNIGASLTHSRIPYVNISANINYVNMNTSYLLGNIIGFRLSKDLLNGKLTTSVSYRNINYEFHNSNSNLLQDVYAADLSFRITKLISFFVSFEGTYKEKESYSNIYLNLTTRF